MYININDCQELRFVFREINTQKSNLQPTATILLHILVYFRRSGRPFDHFELNRPVFVLKLRLPGTSLISDKLDKLRHK